MGARKARPSSGGGRLPRWTVVFLLVVLAIVVGSILLANPPFPDAAELDDVKLDPPAAAPASTALKALLSGPQLPKLSPLLERAGKRLTEGAWPESPAELASAIDALRPALEATRAAILAPGCHPEEELKPGELTPSRELSYVNLLRGSKLIALRSVARAALTEPVAPAAELAALHERLLELERRCSPSLVSAMVLLATVGIVEQALALLLAHPALSEESSRRIWDRLLAGEARPSPMPDALRWEARYQRRVADAIDRGDRKDEGSLPLIWPWYSRDSTIEINEQLGRRAIWLAERPLTDSKAWSARFPEEEYFDKLQRRPRPLVIFRHNGIGKTLLSLAPDLRRYTLKWHQARCLAIAQRARLRRELLERRRPVADEAVRRPASDPRTGTAFTGSERTRVCGFPESYTRGDRTLASGALTRPLAPPPAPAPASAPTPEPPRAVTEER